MSAADTPSAGAATGASSSTRRRPPLVGGLWRRPTFGVEVGVAAAWVALLAMLCGEALAGGGASARALWWCTAGMSGMSGMGALGAGHASSVATSTLAALPMWTLMSAAMMLPAAIPAVRHVAVNSLRWRRRRAISEFLAVYLGIWIVFGAVASGALALWAPARTRVALAVVLALAVLWQTTNLKARALRSCHRSCALPPSGWRATAGVVRFGLLNGGACLASCWAIMLVMVVATSDRLLWTVGLTAVVLAEKVTLRPRRASRRTAALLGCATLGAAVIAAVG